MARVLLTTQAKTSWACVSHWKRMVFVEEKEDTCCCCCCCCHCWLLTGPTVNHVLAQPPADICMSIRHPSCNALLHCSTVLSQL